MVGCLFEREGIDPVRITYEALSADPEGVLRTLLGHLGLDRDAANGVRPEVAKLADGTSREWAARFRADTEAG
jgi:LPS sulfotransferase NodH